MDIKQIDVKLARATTLPVFPKVVQQVMALSDNNEASARDYEHVIAQDTALSAKIIRTANSSFYNRGGEITTLQRAVTQLGNSTIRSVCLAVAFKSTVSSAPTNKRFGAQAFWQHSLAVACISKLIACIHDQARAEEAFMAGLLHDIGKLALSMFLPGEAEYIYRQMDARSISQYEAEMDILKLNHQDIGRQVAERWELPSLYLSSITNHHEPSLEVVWDDPLTAYVHVANGWAYKAGLGLGPAGEANTADIMIQDALEISEAMYEKINHVVANEVSKLSLQMGG